MFATFLDSPTARLQYCRVHQRAWVASLDQWMAFREPTPYRSPVTEAVCDTCTASRHVAGCGEGRSGGRHDWEDEVDLRPSWTRQRGRPPHLQNLGTRTTMRNTLRDELAQTMPRAASSRAHPLSDRGFSLGERHPVRSRP